MSYKYNKKLTEIARYLRKNMTEEEKYLWYDFFKKLPVEVKRQKNIGNYIVDFYIASEKIVIEIDGLQHKMPENEEADKKRDEYLSNLGIKVLRYSNKDINSNFYNVCNDILKNLKIESSL